MSLKFTFKNINRVTSLRAYTVVTRADQTRRPLVEYKPPPNHTEISIVVTSEQLTLILTFPDLIISSLVHSRCTPQIKQKSIHKFLSYPASKQKDKQARVKTLPKPTCGSSN